MKTYEDGLNEAWEAARKIVCDKVHGGYTLTELVDIFGIRSLSEIFSAHTASEAIEKIKEYENSIIVGDEVVDKYGWKRVVISINSDITFMNSDGSFSEYCKKALSDFKKTGRHFPQIEEVLKQMQEEE